MPWRLEWINPSQFASQDEVKEALKVRAYQVWISEIMLQQTRVETVKSYWINWMSKWPTIEDLAAADPEDVLSAWRGLGYYSRATRIHTAAKQVVEDQDLQGFLPELPQDLQKHVPGVGPYTAGAISSIVFGHPVPILDGNVARVLSRQMALYANPKAKATTDALWAAADVLVKRASQTGTDERTYKDTRGTKSRIPGQWNQALMELGSTICTPAPNCTVCPIKSTCMVVKEAQASVDDQCDVPDIEDLCSLCEPMPLDTETADELGPKAQTKAKVPANTKMRQATLSFGQTTPKSQSGTSQKQETVDKAIEKHAKMFPMKLVKQRIRQEECIVCVIARKTKKSKGISNCDFVIEQRPSKGLLANMWQFPSLTISTTEAGDSATPTLLFADEEQKAIALRHAASLLEQSSARSRKAGSLAHVRQLGSITHIFSHLQLIMHVHLLVMRDAKVDIRSESQDTAGPTKNKDFGTAMSHKAPRRWADAAIVEAETMGTGMRNCWRTVQQYLNSQVL
ncbi:DNA glycosylase [Testicularia cyperi]|uniref:Adenine DNA glycosylase n=1 Tax=Testicularia cyperi TaxID=1882483 RepID=A0A317XIA7_9BASI|nr:DNA glycosylase [Testicularia cyperi]